MRNTQNYNLKVLEGNDVPDLPELSQNFDSIDMELKNLEDNKLDKVQGKLLSTNDYTTDEKNKLGNIEQATTNNDFLVGQVVNGVGKWVRKNWSDFITLVSDTFFKKSGGDITGDVNIGTVKTNGYTYLRAGSGTVKVGLAASYDGGATQPLVNLTANYESDDRNTAYLGGCFRVDLRNSSDLFQFCARQAGSSTNTVMSSITSDGYVKGRRFVVTNALSPNVGTKATVTDLKYQLYDYGSGNMAGIGCFTNGLPFVVNGWRVLDQANNILLSSETTGTQVVGSAVGLLAKSTNTSPANSATFVGQNYQGTDTSHIWADGHADFAGAVSIKNVTLDAYKENGTCAGTSLTIVVPRSKLQPYSGATAILNVYAVWTNCLLAQTVLVKTGESTGCSVCNISSPIDYNVGNLSITNNTSPTVFAADDNAQGVTITFSGMPAGFNWYWNVLRINN